jgi:hypothetical protein
MTPPGSREQVAGRRSRALDPRTSRETKKLGEVSILLSSGNYTCSISRRPATCSRDPGHLSGEYRLGRIVPTF